VLIQPLPSLFDGVAILNSIKGNAGHDVPPVLRRVLLQKTAGVVAAG